MTVVRSTITTTSGGSMLFCSNDKNDIILVEDDVLTCPAVHSKPNTGSPSVIKFSNSFLLLGPDLKPACLTKSEQIRGACGSSCSLLRCSAVWADNPGIPHIRRMRHEPRNDWVIDWDSTFNVALEA